MLEQDQKIKKLSDELKFKYEIKKELQKWRDLLIVILIFAFYVSTLIFIYWGFLKC